VIKTAGKKEQNYKIIIYQNQGDFKINVSDFNNIKDSGSEVN